MIDTHSHLDDEAFRDDLPAVIQRAREAGVEKVFVPAIDLPSSLAIPTLCQQYPDYLYSMVGLHPEDVKADWREVLGQIKTLLPQGNNPETLSLPTEDPGGALNLSTSPLDLQGRFRSEAEKELF